MLQSLWNSVHCLEALELDVALELAQSKRM